MAGPGIRYHQIATELSKSFEVTLAVFNPSYIEGFAKKRPRLFQWLKKKEDSMKSRWPWKYCGDYMIVTIAKDN